MIHDQLHVSIEERFSAQGYLHVPSLGLTPESFGSTRRILDELFDRFGTLPRRFAHDLGVARDPQGQPVLPEIMEVSTVAPALRRTPVYRAAHHLARRLLGPGSYLLFDHAIYKPPGDAGTTSWHQDAAYDPGTDRRGLAIWIPLQDTTVVDGAMRYVPESHRSGPIPHLSCINSDGKTVMYLDVDEAATVDQPCDLGGATVHDLHMIHGAGPNRGADVRRAIILDFTTAPIGRRIRHSARRALASRRHGVI